MIYDAALDIIHTSACYLKHTQMSRGSRLLPNPLIPPFNTFYRIIKRKRNPISHIQRKKNFILSKFALKNLHLEARIPIKNLAKYLKYMVEMQWLATCQQC